MTAVVSSIVDITASSATIAAAIDSLNPNSSDIVDSITIGNSVRFWKYPL